MANLFKQELELPQAAVTPSVVGAGFFSREKALITTTFTVIRVRIDYRSAACAPAQHDFNRALSKPQCWGLCYYSMQLTQSGSHVNICGIGYLKTRGHGWRFGSRTL